jgi:hypothetical protein
MTKAHHKLELTSRGRAVLWLTALGAGAAWLSGDGNARLAAALLAAPLLVDFLFKARRLDRVRASVAPRRTAAGAPFLEQVTLHHDGPATLREVLLHEPRTMSSGGSAFVDVLRPGTATVATAACRSHQRSHVFERAFTLSSAWPLGFVRARATIFADAELVTEPARVRLHAEILQSVADQEPASRDRTHLPGPEFHSLREHRGDEDARGVHALRSASLGTLVRRVTEGRMPRAVVLVLDLRRPPGRPVHHGHRRFEWSLGACATLLDALGDRGVETRVLVIGSQTTRTTVRGLPQKRAMLTLLAAADPWPHRELEAAVLEEIAVEEHCFWIAAGGFDAGADTHLPRTTMTVVGGERE